MTQDREVESHKAHILENGGSNPPPAIRLLLILTKSKFSIFSSSSETQPRLYLTVIGGKYGEVAQLVEQYKECESCLWLLQQLFFHSNGICWWFESTPCQLCGAYSKHLDITVNYETKSIMKKFMGHLQQLIS